MYLDNLTLDELYKNHVDVYNHLIINKHALLKRKVRKFNETNWWKWGGARNIKYMKGDCDCIYVNQRTRHNNPFFIHKMSFFDGTILCLIPKHKINLQNWIHYLNNNKELFRDQGLLVNDKYMFNKIKLENMMINDKKID